MGIATLQITDRYTGPLLLKQGFRPFFLGASLWAFLAMVLWVLVLGGGMSIPTRFSLLDWHIHELLFGYTSAVIGGFLLTVAANWTGRTPIRGNQLLLLVVLWVAGRAAVFGSSALPITVVVAVDLAFPLALSALVARELIAGNNRKNLRVVAVFLFLALANLVFHIEAYRQGAALTGVRLGVAAVLLLIMLIGGRIIPAFTRNWLVGRGATHLPSPFGLFDAVTLGFSGMALVCWALLGPSNTTAALLFVSGIGNGVRLVRWRGYATFAEPLVVILHVAYAFVPLGFMAVAVSAAFPYVLSTAAATHVWTAGAITLMTLAVMTRASLGHTGQVLHADWLINLIYLALLISILTRFAAGNGYAYNALITTSAIAWCVAHGAFVMRFWRLFLSSVG